MDAIAQTLQDWERVAGLKTFQAAMALQMDLDRYRRIRLGKQLPSGEELLRIREVIRRAQVEEE